MESNWAAENLQTIRTLMERSALYRRALAPIMMAAGALGAVAAVAGCLLKPLPRLFVAYWLGVAAIGLVVSLLLVRRQALRDAETFWSPPTRRVAQSMLPALFAGFVLGLLALWRLPDKPMLSFFLTWLIVAWTILYGCALNAAGFFMQRGIRYFGWLFVAVGCAIGAWGIPGALARWEGWPHVVMGVLFGVSHLAYGAYLYLTENRKNAA